MRKIRLNRKTKKLKEYFSILLFRKNQKKESWFRNKFRDIRRKRYYNYKFRKIKR